MSTRARAVEGFAGVLADLREDAGRPSFRVLAGRSGAISHTTLHEASQGRRLPSWETTVEYVRACGADPAGYRGRWEAARREVLACSRPGAAGPRRRPTAGGSGRRVLAVLGAAVATLAVLGGAEAAAHLPSAGARPAPGGAAVQAGPSSGALSPGGTHTATVRLRNTGTLTWRSYVLRRLGPPQHAEDCQTIPEVPVPATAPGATTSVPVTVTAPLHPGPCVVRFALTGPQGRRAGTEVRLRLEVG
ncbi:hypothetical protein H9L10_04195 [Phycicoccus endophyticus]|uniref:Nbr1 FW domain-containing protein n=1 Tax=Phycicoccus endophyticus TaxID=1690220 RepID=A0A7G9R3S5_9MICO|nr:NBR1-Ig-like domain-containing protein [Phycicoccus endophyticus]NHI18074.1 hypothetical protein [Phycicoccus endophyticus]QNN50250.1 hypothetical protein H9L10_04195 [Phycicoccus endophyticus]